MMYRRNLGPDEGILFVFERDENLSFYMKNTYVPLSIAFIKADGTIASIADMEPLDETRHRSGVPCRYALEMPRGWFEKHDIAEGAVVRIPGDLSESP